VIAVGDITLETWLELQSIEATDEFDKACQVISILRDVPLDEVLDMPADEALTIADDLVRLTHQMSKPADCVEVSSEDFYPIPFESLEFGAFIDLEALFSGEYRENVDKILAILYRRRLTPPTDITPGRYEDYEAHHLQRAPLFLKVPVRLIHGQVARYVAWRDKLLKNYEGLFGDPETADDGEDEERLTAEESKAKAQEERVKKWSWQLFLWRLAGRDPLKMDDATRMPVLGALNILSMMQELSLETGS
jgi:hypothetical protein